MCPPAGNVDLDLQSHEVNGKFTTQGVDASFISGVLDVPHSPT